MSDIKIAIKNLRNDYTIVLVKDNDIITSSYRGVRPMLEFIESGKDLQGYSVADKVVGKGASMLFVIAKVKEVYAKVISKIALEYLKLNNIKVSYKTLVDYIENRDATGMCPIESVVKDITDIDEGYKLIKSKLIELNKKERINKIRGSLVGGAVGDALGYQCEFIKGIKEKEYVSYNKGIISDDTQMTLFSANAILYHQTKNDGSRLVDSVYLAYKDWYTTQVPTSDIGANITWIKNIEELNHPRAPGNTCMSALNSKEMGTIRYPLNNSKGCGGVMRVAPFGLYFDSLTSGMYAAEAAAITHGHSLGILPAYLLSTWISILLEGKLKLKEALYKAIEIYKEDKMIGSKYDNDYFFSLIDRAIELASKKGKDIENIKKLGEGWVGDEALAIAIYACLKYEDNFEDAIICAVNHDGDSDSTGAIVGNVIGCYLGYNNIPKHFLDNLELKEVILEIADDLAIGVNDSEEWNNKYVLIKK